MDLLTHAPRLLAADAEGLARDLYDLTVVATPLSSERDQNFLLRTPSGEGFVLKIANALEDRVFLEAQQQAMTIVAERTGLCQRVLPLKSGEHLGHVNGQNGEHHFVRLVTYLAGTTAGTLRRHSPMYYRDLGRCVGAIDHALATFDHPAAHRDFYWDLAKGVAVCRRYLPLVIDKAIQRTVTELVAAFERDIAPLLPRLPRSVIHNDANDFNVIVRDDGDIFSRHQRVAGVLDFGDMVHSYTVCDLAIAATYAALGARDPLAAMSDVVRGYHGERPLSETELTTLFGLVRLRMCTSVCVAAHQMQQRPDDEYLAISQEPIKRTLPVVAQIHPRFAEATFRAACGLSPARTAPVVESFLRANASTFAPVLGARLRPDTTMTLSLDIASPLVAGDANENAEPRLTERILAAMTSAGATVGVGGYGEARLIYSTPAFGDPRAAPGERRTVHLGIDLFGKPGTPVHAPLAGEVVLVANNAAPQDYGVVIILEHATDGGVPFYTLYGHLSAESLSGVHPGRRVEAGERIATFGTPGENGGWTPHLHFQLITDLLDLGADFPGVARPTQKDIWLSLCPDPTPLLDIPAGKIPARTPAKSATLATRRQRLGRNLGIAYRDPVKIVRGAMQYLYDDDGRRYIDAYNNVPHVGHAHPRIVRAASEQMAVLNTNTRYLHDTVNRFAERLCATLPAPLGVCYFVNSGSEANELAIRLARAHTGRRDMIVLEAAYHGITTTLIDLSPYKHDGPGGDGAPDWVHAVPMPDVYRGVHRADDPRAGEHYAEYVEQIAVRLTKLGKGIAGYIAESLPSVGGQIVFPAGYLAAAYRYVRDAGGVCIADEIQTGYGRIGAHFWGFQQQGVVPDIVVLGKPIGNGLPIGAVVTTPEIAASFDNGMEFFSTFGGSTVSAAVGIEVLSVVQEERFQAHALAVGGRMLAGLRPLGDRHPIVGDVRGSGLFLGVELVRDRATLEPAGDEASFIANRMREEGILLGTDGPFHNVIKIRPPMPFSSDDADELVATLERVLAQEFGG